MAAGRSWLMRAGSGAAFALVPLVCAGAGMESSEMSDPRTQQAAALMTDFAERTGLVCEGAGRRYLWTDAFAVRNLLALARLSGEERYRALALGLVERVHRVLGRHRGDDPRTGWISGLDEGGGAAHPTRGGLRIGKDLPERAADEPFDERLEWERDGQYFHYLTQWMHALDEATLATGQPQFNRWARELAETAQAAFTYPAGSGRPRMYWKMSIDLTRPLVPTMGHHDPLDAYVAYLRLRATAAGLAQPPGGPDLREELDQAARMIEGGEWATPDPLGTGGLLGHAWRLQQLARQGVGVPPGLVDDLLTASLAGLEYYARREDLEQPAQYRLAFRELGLAIGLHAAERLRAEAEADPAAVSPSGRELLRGLERHIPLADRIQSFWLDPANRQAASWIEHRDINEVMLATSLMPEGRDLSRR